MTDANNRSQLDKGSGSTAMSDKSLIHDYVHFSTAASLPNFHGIITPRKNDVNHVEAMLEKNRWANTYEHGDAEFGHV